jgi:hypothetical protein
MARSSKSSIKSKPKRRSGGRAAASKAPLAKQLAKSGGKNKKARSIAARADVKRARPRRPRPTATFPIRASDFSTLWTNHPHPNEPCDIQTYPNQCAIRLGVALHSTGFSISTFTGNRCHISRHAPRHIRAAQELADWLRNNLRQGEPQILTGEDRSAMQGRRGIAFIQNGWPPGGDHIDLWDGANLKGGPREWITRGTVWFWSLD